MERMIPLDTEKKELKSFRTFPALKPLFSKMVLIHVILIIPNFGIKHYCDLFVAFRTEP